MNLNELATAVTQKLPILIIIINNGVLGMVRQWQSMFYDSRYSHTTLNRKTDFVKLTRAFGGEGKTIYSIDQLKEAFQEGFPDDMPFVLDCRTDMDIKVFPMIPPQGSVKNILVK